MNKIRKRPYCCLVDFNKIYSFMIENYEVDWRNGKPATAFEYSQVLFWTDHTQNHRITYWEEDGKVIALCWYDGQIGEAHINLKPGYEFLIPDIIDTAEERLSKEDGSLELNLYDGQKNIINEIEKRGYTKLVEYTEGIYDFSKDLLNYSLPEGFHFVSYKDCDRRKLIEAQWRGFNNPEQPPEYMQQIEDSYHTDDTPHSTSDLNVVIANENEDYVCAAGMWMVPENHLAYMEPLCTVAEYRGKGLARAALSELVRRTKPLGATHMTGGSDKFYFHIGYDPLIKCFVYKRKRNN